MTAAVDLVQRIGGAPTVDVACPYLNLHGDDTYVDGPSSYLQYPVYPRSDGAPTYSMERWVRLRFQQPFGAVRAFRFWVPGWVEPEGWTVRWGASTAFDIPKLSLSSYALYPLPTTDPGPGNPNIGGEDYLEGTVTQYSNWVVVQASVNGDAPTGPLLGYGGNNLPLKIPYRFNWTEN